MSIEYFKGGVSDDRVATLIFFCITTLLTLQELGKTTALTFRKKYMTYRFAAYFWLFIHSFFGGIVALWIGNNIKNIVSFVSLVITCSANVVYQTIALYLVTIKLQTVTSMKQNTRRLIIATYIVMLLKFVLSITSLGIMISIESSLGANQFYSQMNYNGSMLYAAMINLIGNICYITLMTTVQCFFVFQVHRTIKEKNTSTIKTFTTQEEDKPFRKMVNRRQEIILIFLGLISTILLILSEFVVLPHSISLAFLSFVSVSMLRLFDKMDKSALLALHTKPEPRQSVLSTLPATPAPRPLDPNEL